MRLMLSSHPLQICSWSQFTHPVTKVWRDYTIYRYNHHEYIINCKCIPQNIFVLNIITKVVYKLKYLCTNMQSKNIYLINITGRIFEKFKYSLTIILISCKWENCLVMIINLTAKIYNVLEMSIGKLQHKMSIFKKRDDIFFLKKYTFIKHESIRK